MLFQPTDSISLIKVPVVFDKEMPVQFKIELVLINVIEKAIFENTDRAS